MLLQPEAVALPPSWLLPLTLGEAERVALPRGLLLVEVQRLGVGESSGLRESVGALVVVAFGVPVPQPAAAVPLAAWPLGLSVTEKEREGLEERVARLPVGVPVPMLAVREAEMLRVTLGLREGERVALGEREGVRVGAGEREREALTLELRQVVGVRVGALGVALPERETEGQPLVVGEMLGLREVEGLRLLLLQALSVRLPEGQWLGEAVALPPRLLLPLLLEV